jgi:hypothetical protein
MMRHLAATWSLGAVLLMTVMRCAPPRPDDEGASERARSQSAVAPGGLAEESRTAGDGTASEDTLRRRLPGMLRTVEGTPVVGWTGPGGDPFEVAIRTADPTTNMRRFGSITMRNSARTRSPDLGQYPCTSCHLGRGMVLRDERITDAHQNIQPLHPAQTGATCSTCHAPDNIERLALRSGDRATLDHAYRLCAQCHFQQVESWAGGAHGKRLDGWQGRRVVMGCADCHDPHRPALGTRIPFRGPTLQRPALRRP